MARCVACNEELDDNILDELFEFCNPCYDSYLDAREEQDDDIEDSHNDQEAE